MNFACVEHIWLISKCGVYEENSQCDPSSMDTKEIFFCHKKICAYVILHMLRKSI